MQRPLCSAMVHLSPSYVPICPPVVPGCICPHLSFLWSQGAYVLTCPSCGARVHMSSPAPPVVPGAYVPICPSCGARVHMFPPAPPVVPGCICPHLPLLWCQGAYVLTCPSCGARVHMSSPAPPVVPGCICSSPSCPSCGARVHMSPSVSPVVPGYICPHLPLLWSQGSYVPTCPSCVPVHLSSPAPHTTF